MALRPTGLPAASGVLTVSLATFRRKIADSECAYQSLETPYVSLNVNFDRSTLLHLR